MLNKRMFKAALVKAGFTQKSLSKEIHMTERAMSSKVNGAGSFDTEQIDKMCLALGIDDGTEKVQIFLSQVPRGKDGQSGRKE